MDQYFDALQKSHTREGILGSVNETKEEFLEKGKKAQIGEIRTWKGVKFQKQPNGGWTPVKADKKKGHYEEFVDADTGEVVKVWKEDASESSLSVEEELADIERQLSVGEMSNSKVSDPEIGGAEGSKKINGFDVHFDLDFADKAITIHIKDAENKPVVAKDIWYGSGKTKGQAIQEALSLIKEKVSNDKPASEKEIGLTYQEKIKLDNEARKEFSAIEGEFKSALESLKDRYDERKQLEIDQEQEVGSLYVAGKDEEAEKLAQDYGEKFNTIDDEIGMLNSKIDELKPKYIQARQEYNKKADEIWN